jgi:hypothetical protein
MQMRILMILTAGSGARQIRSPSIDHVVEAYRLLQDSGTEVVIASSQGGSPPIRRGRERSTHSASSNQHLQSDRSARDAISDTLALEQIYPDEFDGVISMAVLEEPAQSAATEAARSLLDAFLTAGKPIGIVPSALEFAPGAVFEGLLVTGDEIRAPSLAATAILAALNHREGARHC